MNTIACWGKKMHFETITDEEDEVNGKKETKDTN